MPAEQLATKRYWTTRVFGAQPRLAAGYAKTGLRNDSGPKCEKRLENKGFCRVLA